MFVICYSLNFFLFFAFVAQVVFQNESSKEFLHYLIELTVKKCSPLDTIRLTTCVRKPIEHKLVVENPLEDPITMNLSCDSNWLTFEKTLLMDACSEVLQ